MTFHVPERYRIQTGEFRSTPDFGNNGAFWLGGILPGRRLFCIASDDQEEGDDVRELIGKDGGWEHVSVSGRRDHSPSTFTPNWEEMCYVKALFWDTEDVVVQYHPARSAYVNLHPHCLHLWRPLNLVLPAPDPERVGPRGLEVAA